MQQKKMHIHYSMFLHETEEKVRLYYFIFLLGNVIFLNRYYILNIVLFVYFSKELQPRNILNILNEFEL
jgi:hypothetical protein